jgi:hypothetical protein
MKYKDFERLVKPIVANVAAPAHEEESRAVSSRRDRLQSTELIKR